jgi:flagellar hook-associated protein 1 FlgK
MSSVFGIGLSALQASQAGLRVTSQNIANANTPGYVRAELQVSNSAIGGAGGVNIEGVRRAADVFLARLSYSSAASAAGAGARADGWDRAQAQFGDPTDETSLFAALDEVFAGFAEVSLDPASTIRRIGATDNIDRFFASLNAAATGLQDLLIEVDTRIADTAQKAQAHLNAIVDLNLQISQSVNGGGEASAAQNALGVVLDDLSKLMDIRVATAADGAIEVRTSSGVLLVGGTASTLSHEPIAGMYATRNQVMLTDSSGATYPLDSALRSGELRGLIDSRDIDLRNLAEALGGFASALAEAFNGVHNENSTAPAPNQLVGRQTGLLATDSLGFTGQSILGVVNADGELVDRLQIDFDAGTITPASTGVAASFSNAIGPITGDPTTFIARLNTALGAHGGTATFTDGVMSLSGGANGLVTQQDATDPSARAGRGFGHFFGLNDLVRREEPGFFEAGVAAGDAHGLLPGGVITFRVADATGASAGERQISISGALAAPGATWSDLIAALNAGGGAGLSPFGSASFNAAEGRLVVTAQSGYKVEVLSDQTTRAGTGVSASELFGLSHVARAGRAGDFAVRADIAADPDKLALARPDLAAALGERVIEAGDTRGAVALNQVRDKAIAIPAAGMMSAQNASLATYSARFGGEVGRRAAQAGREAGAAEAVSQASLDRRLSAEGVSIDDELVRLTVYQQHYAAAARIIQAASEMMDLLTRLGT